MTRSTLEELLARCDVEHVRLDGARFHVPSWVAYEGPLGECTIMWCSTARCRLNRLGIKKLSDIGLDPAKYAPVAQALIGRR